MHSSSKSQEVIIIFVLFYSGGLWGRMLLSRNLLENISTILKIVNPVIVVQEPNKDSFMVVPCLPRTLTPINVQSYQWKSDDNLPVLNDDKHSVDQVNGDLYIKGHASNARYHCEIIDENGIIHKYYHTTLTAYLPSLEVHYVAGFYLKSPCYLANFIDSSLMLMIPRVSKLIIEIIKKSTSQKTQEHQPENFIFQDGFIENEHKEIEKVCRTGFIFKPFSGKFLENELDKFMCQTLECARSLLHDYLNLDKQTKLLICGRLNTESSYAYLTRFEIYNNGKFCQSNVSTDTDDEDFMASEVDGIASQIFNEAELRRDESFIKRINAIQPSQLPEFEANYTITYVNIVGSCLAGYTYYAELICIPCPPGTFQSSEYDKYGITKIFCKSCIGHTYNSLFGSTYCSKCNPEYILSSDKSACYRSSVHQITKMSQGELKQIINESDEVYYDLGSFTSLDGKMTKLLKKGSTSLILVVVADLIAIALIFISVVAYFTAKRNLNIKLKLERLDRNELQFVTILARSQKEEYNSAGNLLDIGLHVENVNEKETSDAENIF